MESWQWAALLKPLVAILIFAAIVLPLEWLVDKLLPDCKLKRILFFKWKV